MPAVPVGAVCIGTSFVNANLVGANLSGVDLRGAVMEHAQMAGTNVNSIFERTARRGLPAPEKGNGRQNSKELEPEI